MSDRLMDRLPGKIYPTSLGVCPRPTLCPLWFSNYCGRSIRSTDFSNNIRGRSASA